MTPIKLAYVPSPLPSAQGPQPLPLRASTLQGRIKPTHQVSFTESGKLLGSHLRVSGPSSLCPATASVVLKQGLWDREEIPKPIWFCHSECLM